MIWQSTLLPSARRASSPIGHRLRRDGVADQKHPAGSRNLRLPHLLVKLHQTGWLWEELLPDVERKMAEMDAR